MEEFNWERHPDAEQFVLNYVEQAKKASAKINQFERDLEEKSSTHYLDFLDHIALNEERVDQKELKALGFTPLDVPCRGQAFHHPGALLPKIVLYSAQEASRYEGLYLLVDSIEFCQRQARVPVKVEGTLYSPYRRGCLFTENGVNLWAVERRGTQAIEPVMEDPKMIEKHCSFFYKWYGRLRDPRQNEASMKEALSLAKELAEELGPHRAASLVMEVERYNWQQHNKAAQIQKMRQDQMGMGWGNHDHHTFRSSRHLFKDLVEIFEVLGFKCRERFYAGEEAGWGAQVVENKEGGFICFLDVDMDAEEITGDFPHLGLSVREGLGTIGLWCALHGDSMCAAGMHHLEGQFDFIRLKEDLAKHGVAMMDPFSNMDYLKQAFTQGEVWKVDPVILQELLSENKINQEEYERFLKKGAVGSHLENLERKDGYNGFNQKNVSGIIKRTDPRTLSES